MENANDDFCVRDLTVTLVISWNSRPYMFQVSMSRTPFSYFFFLSIQGSRRKKDQKI